MTLWDELPPDLQADPRLATLAPIFRRLIRGRRCYVPKLGQNRPDRDDRIRGTYRRWRKDGRDRKWCLAILAERYGLAVAFVERIVYRRP